MKDILRLGRYLRPYKGRILMAVAASFISTVFLSGFWVLASSVIRDTLTPPAAAVDLLDAGTGAPPSRPAHPEGSAESPGPAAAPAPAASSGTGALARMRERLVGLRD